MTYPVGGLPSAGTVADLQRVTTPQKSAAFTHGGSDLDLTDPANNCAPAATEFVCTTTGNLVARLAGDAVERTYALTAGNVLRGVFVLAKSTSTADGFFRS